MTQVASFVGIDVAKGKLDWCIRGMAHGTAPNTAAGCAKLAGELKRWNIKIAVMEASGGYEQTIALALRGNGLLARIVDPKRIRDFARAAGRRAKNDPIDADTIAWFAETFNLEPGSPPDRDREQLAALVGERQDLVEMRTQCLNRAEHKCPALCQQLRKDVLKHINRAIAKIEAAIATLIAQNQALDERARLLASVPCLGPQSVAALIAWLPELGQISNLQIAALLGVAPYADDSGQQVGVRHIAGGRRQLRNILYMAVVGGATQHNPVLKTYYKRLLARGKLSKVALVACLRKLIVILNVMVARQEYWNPPTQIPVPCP